MSYNEHLKEVNAKKFSKLTMEKKRRARINASLKEIRKLLRDSGKLGEFQCSRMEKAEVLEAAVLHLREKRFHARQILNLRHHGYNACAESILHRLATVYSCESPVYQGVKHFLQDRCKKELLPLQLTNSANKISVFATNQEPSCSTVSNHPSSTKDITIPLYTNHDTGSPVAPGNTVPIHSLDYNRHPSFPKVVPFWRPW